MYWRSLGTSTREPTADPLSAGEVIVDPVLEGVGHGDELGAGVGREGLLGRAAAPAAAADQADLDRAAAGGMDHGTVKPGHCGGLLLPRRRSSPSGSRGGWMAAAIRRTRPGSVGRAA